MNKLRMLATAMVAALAVGMSGLPVSATHIAGEASRDPNVIGKAMEASAQPGLVTSATYGTDGTEVSHAAQMVSQGAMAGFPRDGNDFGMISSGNTNFVNDPNSSGSLSTNDDGTVTAGGELGGLDTNDGQDLAGLNVNLNVPQVASPCLQVDVKFFSEEFPEFVGSQYNDFAIARVNNTAPPTVDTTTNSPVAPGNFLLDGFGAQLTINNNFLVSLGNAAGTTYDGATPTLRAQTALAPGTPAQSVSFWVGDMGDSWYDTTLFVDNLRVIDQNPCPTVTVGPSFQSKPKVKIKGDNVIFSGQILPAAPGQKVFMTLFAKNSPFKKVAKKKAILNAQSKYKKKFKLPNGKRCMIKVLYKGDDSHDPSTSKKKFKC